MPFGCSSVVPLIAERLRATRPRRVLDLGIGLGFNGAVVRNYLFGEPVHLAGVELWPAYRSHLWRAYDAIELADVRASVLLDAGPWDAVLLTDVIEHLEAADGAALLRRIAGSLSPRGWALASTPAVWIAQGPAWGNDGETHRSLWTATDFEAVGWSVLRFGTPDEHGHRMLVAIAECQADCLSCVSGP